MAQRIKDAKKGVMVRVSPGNSKKIIKIIEQTRRTFSSEVNFGIEHYADKRIAEYKDNGK